jgi:hypothetical protein
MKIDREMIQAALGRLQEEAGALIGNLRDKGAKPFLRPLMFSFIFAYGSYEGVLVPAKKKLARMESKLVTALATEEYATAYKDILAELRAYYQKLPAERHREKWLFELYIQSLKDEDITSDLRPPGEDETGGLIYQRLEMTSKMKYTKMISWLTRVQASKPLLRVTKVTIAKDTTELGMNSVTCAMETVIPKRRFGS